LSYADRTKRPPRSPTDREVKRLLDVTGRAKAGFRDHVIFSLAVGCGLRESEIVGLDVLHVAKLQSGGALVPMRSIQLHVFKRAGADPNPADQRVHVPDATFYKLEKWLRSEWRDRRPSERTPLFVARTGHRLSTRRVRELFQEWQTRAGFDQLYNFHALRHYAISAVRRKTGDIRIAQRFARHANIATTTRYDHPSDEEISAAVKGLIG
jgi:site-specific recombinase XerC